MKTYLTSDLHLGHRLVTSLRGFATAQEHDEAFADAWSQTVRREDIVWILGDLAMRTPHALAILGDLPGRKRLILGNHDDAHPKHRSAPNRIEVYAAVFEYVAQSARLRFDGFEFLLSHYPYDGDHTREDRDRQWRLPDCGVPLLHGHVHAGEQVTLSAAGTPQLHVGIDAWGFTPQPIERFVALVRD